MIFTADSDSVCEGSNPSPAAMMTTGNCIYAVPRAPILKLVFALFVVLPDLVPVPAPYCAILQGPHHVVSGSDVLAPQNRLSICSLRLIPVTAGSSGAAHIMAKLREMRLYLTGTIIQLSISRPVFDRRRTKNKPFPMFSIEKDLPYNHSVCYNRLAPQSKRAT